MLIYIIANLIKKKKLKEREAYELNFVGFFNIFTLLLSEKREKYGSLSTGVGEEILYL